MTPSPENNNELVLSFLSVRRALGMLGFFLPASLGAVVLLASHLQTGVLNAQTLPFSAALALPAMVGLLLGYRLGDRLDEARFRRWTHALLVVTGLNLIRQAVVS